MATEKVTKLAAGERQLREAIRLYFGERDVIATHALAAAAGQLFRDLLRAEGRSETGIIDTLVNEHVRPARRDEFTRLVKKPQNFFKHADRDPDDVLTFDAEASELFILDAMLMHLKLAGIAPLESKLFQWWFLATHPEFLKDEELQQRIIANQQRAPLTRAYMLKVLCDPDELAALDSL